MLPAGSWLNYHSVFLLDPVELGCTHSMEHMIKVTDDTPFKEQFRQIPCNWLRRFRTTCRRCWSQALSGQPECLV